MGEVYPGTVAERAVSVSPNRHKRPRQRRTGVDTRCRQRVDARFGAADTLEMGHNIDAFRIVQRLPVRKLASGGVVVDKKALAERLVRIDRHFGKTATDRVARASVVPDAIRGCADRIREPDVADELLRGHVVEKGLPRSLRVPDGRAFGVAQGESAHGAVDVGDRRPNDVNRVVGARAVGEVGGRTFEQEAVSRVRARIDVGTDEPHTTAAQVVGAVHARGQRARHPHGVGLAARRSDRTNKQESVAVVAGRPRDEVLAGAVATTQTLQALDGLERDARRREVSDALHGIVIPDQVVVRASQDRHAIATVALDRRAIRPEADVVARDGHPRSGQADAGAARVDQRERLDHRAVGPCGDDQARIVLEIERDNRLAGVPGGGRAIKVE